MGCATSTPRPNEEQTLEQLQELKKGRRASAARSTSSATAATSESASPPPSRGDNGSLKELESSLAPSAEGTLFSRETPLASRYKLGSFLGQGAFGIVRCAHSVDGAPFPGGKPAKPTPLACKSMHRPAKRGAGKSAHWGLALAEVEVWADVSFPRHPGILQLLEVVEPPGGAELHLITECCAGGELFDVLDDMEFSEQTLRM